MALLLPRALFPPLTRWARGILDGRQMSLRELISGVIVLSLLTPFFASVLSAQPLPRLSDILFGFFPFLAFLAAATAVALHLAWHERGSLARGGAFAGSLLACLFAILISPLRWWNDGRYFSTLPLSEVVTALATLSFFPLRSGPDALIRFFPLVCALFVFWRGRRHRSSRTRSFFVGVLVFLAVGLMIHAPSLVVSLIAILRGSALSTSADAFRLLVSAQADGYWTYDQAARFFLPIGRQGENGILMVHAAIAFLATSLTCVVASLTETRVLSALLWRLRSRSISLFVFISLLGLALGLSGHRISSYTEVLAGGIFLLTIGGWLFAWRIRADLNSLRRDERERPDLPLPSGAVSVGAAEEFASLSIALSFFGAALLGWPVFLALLSALLIERFVRRGAEARTSSEVIGEAILRGAQALSLSVAAFSVGLREQVISPWPLRIFLGIAMLAGIVFFSRKHPRSSHEA